MSCDKVRLECNVKTITRDFPVPEGCVITQEEVDAASRNLCQNAARVIADYFPAFDKYIQIAGDLEMERLLAQAQLKKRRNVENFELREFTISVSQYLDTLDEKDLSVYEYRLRLKALVLDLSTALETVYNTCKLGPVFDDPHDDATKPLPVLRTEHEFRQAVTRLIEEHMLSITP